MLIFLVVELKTKYLCYLILTLYSRPQKSSDEETFNVLTDHTASELADIWYDFTQNFSNVYDNHVFKVHSMDIGRVSS